MATLAEHCNGINVCNIGTIAPMLFQLDQTNNHNSAYLYIVSMKAIIVVFNGLQGRVEDDTETTDK
jgi:hypothetical protein